MTHLRTSLARYQPYTPMNDTELRHKAAKLWHETGTVMIKPEWLHNAFDAQHMKNVAEKMFGKRRAQ